MITNLIKIDTGTTMDAPNGNKIIQYRITTTDGEMFLCWLPSNVPTPTINQSYELEFNGETSWKWGDDKHNRIYKKVKLKRSSNTISNDNPFVDGVAEPYRVNAVKSFLEERKQQTQPLSNEYEYHKMAMDYLFRVGNTDLVSLSKLAPHMRSIMEGSINPTKLEQLYSELNVFSN